MRYRAGLRRPVWKPIVSWRDRWCSAGVRSSSYLFHDPFGKFLSGSWAFRVLSLAAGLSPAAPGTSPPAIGIFPAKYGIASFQPCARGYAPWAIGYTVSPRPAPSSRGKGFCQDVGNLWDVVVKWCAYLIQMITLNIKWFLSPYSAGENVEIWSSWGIWHESPTYTSGSILDSAGSRTSLGRSGPHSPRWTRRSSLTPTLSPTPCSFSLNASSSTSVSAVPLGKVSSRLSVSVST